MRLQLLVLSAVAFRSVPVAYRNFRYRDEEGRCSPTSREFALFGGGR